jgi:hypothetical protein
MSEAARTVRCAAAPGFLARVINGAFERASPLDPRLPSLFEPQTTTLGARLEWPAEPAGKNQENDLPARVEVSLGREADRRTAPDAGSARSDAPASRERPAIMDAPRISGSRNRSEPATPMEPHQEADRRTAPDAASARRDAPASSERPVIMDAPRVPGRRDQSELATPMEPHQEPAVAAVSAVPALARSLEHEPERARNVLSPKSLPIVVDGPPSSRHGTVRERRHALLEFATGVLPAQKVISQPETIRAPIVEHTPEASEASPRPIGRWAGLPDDSGPPALAAQRIVVEPPRVRQPPQSERLRAQPAAPDPEPVVNVTIGRIEVRAAHALPGPARQRSQGPRPLSLDDYLRQRCGGR